jgi:hypothetical protein
MPYYYGYRAMKEPLLRVANNPLCRLCAVADVDGKITVEVFGRQSWPEPSAGPTREWEVDDDEENPMYQFMKDILWLGRNVDTLFFRDPDA